MMQSQDSFGLYVINLPTETARRDSANRESTVIELTPEFVPATTPNFSTETSSRFVSLGVKAVWLSHLKAMRMFLESNHDFALIAEDDFKIEDAESIKVLLKCARSIKADMIQFGYLKPGLEIKILVLFTNIQQSIFRAIALFCKLSISRNSSLKNRMRVRDAANLPWGLVANNTQPGAHFYLVSRRFAESIQLLNNPQFLSIDDFYSSLARMRSFYMFRTRRSLVSQKDFQSWSGDRFVNI